MTSKYLALCLPLLLGFFSAPAQDHKTDSAIIVSMERKFLEAEFRLDTATISEMMDPGFISIGAWGVSGKDEELKGIYANIEKRLKEKHIIDSFYFDDVRVKIYDGSAVCTFIVVTNGKIDRTAFSNRRTRFYDFWVKKNGIWKIVSSQVTKL